MEKELIRLFEEVKKAADLAATSADSITEEDRCLDAFKLLKKFPVNYQILVSTQVGKHLRALTNNPKKKIQAFAMDLVGIWKAIILKGISKIKKEKVEKTHKNGTSSSENGNIKGCTMEKELIQLYEVVKKAADTAATSTNGEVEENRCLDAFKLLKKFSVNYQILLSTQVGKHLRVLTKHPRKKIRAFAIDLIEAWKTIILKEISKNKKEKVDQKVSKVENKTDRNGTSSSQNGNIKAQAADSNVRSAKTISAENVKVEKVQKALVIKLKVHKAEKTDKNLETSTSKNAKKKYSNVSVANIAKDEKKQVSRMPPKKASSSSKGENCD